MANLLASHGYDLGEWCGRRVAALWRDQLESGEGETKHENAGNCDGRDLQLHSMLPALATWRSSIRAQRHGQLLSLETIAERAARSPRAVLISNAEVPSACLFK